MDGFIHQLISENIEFYLNWNRKFPENSSVIIKTNNDDQWDYFYYHCHAVTKADKDTLEIKMDDISDFPQITWSGLIPPTK